MEQQTHNGRCLCGQVQFTVTGTAQWIAYCHCESCRRHTGSTVATFVGVHPKQATFTAAPPKAYQSSPGVSRTFCPNCGTPLTYQSDRWPDEIHFYISGFNQPERFPPAYHVFCQEQITWFDTKDTLPRYPHSSEPFKSGNTP